MMKITKFFGFTILPIGGSREKTAFHTLKDHAEAVIDCVKKLRDAITAYAEGKIDKAEKLVELIDQKESEADGIQSKFQSMLGSGAFLPAFRGDLSRLSEDVDDVADMAEEAIRVVYLRPNIFEKLAEAEKKNEEAKAIRLSLEDLTSKAVASAEALKATISILLKDMDACTVMAEDIHRCEGESDAVEEKLLKNLYEYEDLLDPISVMQLRDLIEQIGAISNEAEDAGDRISAMCVALRA